MCSFFKMLLLNHGFALFVFLHNRCSTQVKDGGGGAAAAVDVQESLFEGDDEDLDDLEDDE